MITDFLSAFCSFNSSNIVLLSVVPSVTLRENQVSKFILKSNITISLITMPSNQQLTSLGSITTPRTPRDRLSSRPT